MQEFGRRAISVFFHFNLAPLGRWAKIKELRAAKWLVFLTVNEVALHFSGPVGQLKIPPAAIHQPKWGRHFALLLVLLSLLLLLLLLLPFLVRLMCVSKSAAVKKRQALGPAACWAPLASSPLVPGARRPISSNLARGPKGAGETRGQIARWRPTGRTASEQEEEAEGGKVGGEIIITHLFCAKLEGRRRGRLACFACARHWLLRVAARRVGEKLGTIVGQLCLAPSAEELA